MDDLTPHPKPAQKIISPMLAEGVEVKSHAMGLGPENTSGGSMQTSESFKTDSDFFGTKPYDPNPPAPEKKPDVPLTPQQVAQAQMGNVTPVTQFKQDAPEQKFNMDPGAANIDSQTNPVIDQAAAQATSDLVDTIVDIYERAVPEITHENTKIKTKDIKTVKALEEKGEVMVGLVDDLRNINKDNKKLIEDRCKSDAQMLKKPLKRWLTTKNIPVPPWVEVLVVVAFIGLTYFLLIMQIKTSSGAKDEG